MPRTEAIASEDWHTGAGLEVLQIRATLLARIRSWFAEQGVLEVETPLLSRFATPDPALESFKTTYLGPGSPRGEPLYLHTSPEFFMKRLLAAGSGPVYRLAPVFRNGEFGKRHNPEFTMLEWYRPGLDHNRLMDEVDALLATVLDGYFEYRPAQRISYRQCFIEHTGLDPWVDGVKDFRAFAGDRLGPVPVSMSEAELDPWLDLLLSHWIEPRLGDDPVFVYDYPVSQAALARVRHDEMPVAERFELYVGGIELANGFHELVDADEQQRRFEAENRRREEVGAEPVPVDRHFLAALRSGMPDTAGVALGFDRLVMLAAGLADIDAAMAFSFSRV